MFPHYVVREDEREGTLRRLPHGQNCVLRSFNSLANSDQFNEMLGRMISELERA